MENKVIENPDFENLSVEGYKWVVMYRDHYKNNGKGEYFKAENFSRLMKEQSFWFYNEERPVFKIILTNDDVPVFVKERGALITELQRLRFEKEHCHTPAKGFDGRFTRRTHPELYAEYDKEVAESNKRFSELKKAYESVEQKLQKIKYYSSTLHYIDL